MWAEPGIAAHHPLGFIAPAPPAPNREPLLSGMEASAAGVAAALGGRFKVTQLLSPRDMVALHQPHEAWPAPGSAAPPPILSFFSFAAAEVLGGAGAGAAGAQA